jgi:hypothetical protein
VVPAVTVPEALDDVKPVAAVTILVEAMAPVEMLDGLNAPENNRLPLTVRLFVTVALFSVAKPLVLIVDAVIPPLAVNKFVTVALLSVANPLVVSVEALTPANVLAPDALNVPVETFAVDELNDKPVLESKTSEVPIWRAAVDAPNDSPDVLHELPFAVVVLVPRPTIYDGAANNCVDVHAVLLFVYDNETAPADPRNKPPPSNNELDAWFDASVIFLSVTFTEFVFTVVNVPVTFRLPRTLRSLFIVTAPTIVDVPPMERLPELDNSPVPTVRVFVPVIETVLLKVDEPLVERVPPTVVLFSVDAPVTVRFPPSDVNPLPTVNVFVPVTVVAPPSEVVELTVSGPLIPNTPDPEANVLVPDWTIPAKVLVPVVFNVFNVVPFVTDNDVPILAAPVVVNELDVSAPVPTVASVVEPLTVRDEHAALPRLVVVLFNVLMVAVPLTPSVEILAFEIVAVFSVLPLVTESALTVAVPIRSKLPVLALMDANDCSVSFSKTNP